MSRCLSATYTTLMIVVAAITDAIGIATPLMAATPLQPTAVVHLTSSDASQFQLALASLASQGHVALVAEGIPFKSKFAVADAADLTAQMPLDQAVSKMAAAYDYDAQRQGNVFVLTKRYTNSHDLPCVTLKECRLAADNLSAVLGTFNPNFATSVYAGGPDGRRDAVVSFFRSLSPAQLQAAQNKTLYYGNLSPSQQSLVQGLFLYQYVQMPLDKVSDVIANLDYAPQSALKVRNEDGYSGLFMEVPNINANAPPVLSSLTAGLTPLDRPQPSMIRVPPLSIADPLPSESTTLGAIVAALKPVDGKAPAVDASLIDKPVTAAGIGNVGSMNMMHALSALYGLDLEEIYEERPLLKPQAVRLPGNLGEIDAAVWASLPVSYMRALHIAHIDPRPTPNAGVPHAATEEETFQQQMRSMQLPSDFQQEANERLLLAMQPQLKKQGLNVRVAVSSLDKQEKTALAVSLMTNLISALYEGFSGSPHQSVLDCVGNMDQTIIYTVPGEDAQINNQDVPSIYLEGTDPITGQQVGLGGVRYFSQK